MRSKLLAGFAAAVVGVTLVACSDAPSAPTAAPTPVAAFAKGGIPGKPGDPRDGGSSSTDAITYLSGLHDTVSRAAAPVVGIQRVTPLGGAATASATIGSEGGLVELPAAGAYLWVPPGAVSVPTTFRMTAKPGKAAAYDFEPAGSVFQIPLVLFQDKSVLSTSVPVGFSAPSLGYFSSDADVDASTATGTGSQLRAPIALSTPQYLAFPVWHFSGYIVCWGRSSMY